MFEWAFFLPPLRLHRGQRVELNPAIGDLGIVPNAVADLFVNLGDATDRLADGAISHADLVAGNPQRRTERKNFPLKIFAAPITATPCSGMQPLVHNLAPGKMFATLKLAQIGAAQVLVEMKGAG